MPRGGVYAFRRGRGRMHWSCCLYAMHVVSTTISTTIRGFVLLHVHNARHQHHHQGLCLAACTQCMSSVPPSGALSRCLYTMHVISTNIRGFVLLPVPNACHEHHHQGLCLAACTQCMPLAPLPWSAYQQGLSPDGEMSSSAGIGAVWCITRLLFKSMPKGLELSFSLFCRPLKPGKAPTVSAFATTRTCTVLLQSMQAQ